MSIDIDGMIKKIRNGKQGGYSLDEIRMLMKFSYEIGVNDGLEKS